MPDNAFRELKPGEEYEPIMRPDKVYPEVTPWSVSWGFVMVVLFSAAAAYLGLKVGQVFEAAIPIAIIAIGLQQATHRKNAMGENVIIQSIGACSGAVVAGAIFVLPAIYMLDLQASFFKIFLASALGGVLGILFLIPFRKYFQVSLPRGHGYHAGARLGRAGRQSGQAPSALRFDRWSLRFYREHVRIVERELYLACDRIRTVCC